MEAADELVNIANKRMRYRWRPYRVILYLLVYTGMRKSEVRGLRWCDVGLVNNLIRVRQRADKLNNIGVPKTAGSRRTIPIPDDLQSILVDWRNHSNPGGEELVVKTRRGTPISESNIQNRFWVPVQEKARVDRLPLHSLRHYCASALIDSGLDVVKVASLMGHETASFTLRFYAHLFTKREQMGTALRDAINQGFRG